MYRTSSGPTRFSFTWALAAAVISVGAASTSSKICSVAEGVDSHAEVASTLIQAQNWHHRSASIAEESDNGTPEQSLFELFGVDGSSAELTEKGYADVAGLCCHSEMSKFIERVILDMGLTICGNGGPDGVAHYYMGCGHTQSLFALKQDINDSLGKDCPIAASGICPVRQPVCPDFQDDRRRRCVSTQSTTAETTTTLPGTTTTTTNRLRGTADCDNRIAVNANFASSRLAKNNLGGQAVSSQDPARMVFEAIGKFQGKSFDLVIQNVSEYIGTGGGFNGNFAYIQLQGGYSTDFTFSFRQSRSQAPLTLPEFHLGFFDIDQSLQGKMTERLTISGHHSLAVDPLAEFGVTNQSGGVVIISSKYGGTGCDNPKDPLNLKVVKCNQGGVDEYVDQWKRSVMAVYRNVSQFTLTLETTCTSKCNSGRMFYFSCASALAEMCF